MELLREKFRLSLKLGKLWLLRLFFHYPSGLKLSVQLVTLKMIYHGKTAYELLKGRKPNISYLHVFGCDCYILNQRNQCSKFEAKDDEGVFLGY